MRNDSNSRDNVNRVETDNGEIQEDGDYLLFARRMCTSIYSNICHEGLKCEAFL